MIILGIDPGFAITGYGVVDYTGNKFKVIDYGVVSTDKSELFSSRLQSIYDTLSFIIDQYHPDCMAIEELFFNNNAKTAIMAAHGRGVAMLACTKKGLPCYEYTPLQVKQNIAGYGRAEKRQVQQMVKVILKLDSIPKPDDAADALAIAICHAHSLLSSDRV